MKNKPNQSKQQQQKNLKYHTCKNKQTNKNNHSKALPQKIQSKNMMTFKNDIFSFNMLDYLYS